MKANVDWSSLDRAMAVARPPSGPRDAVLRAARAALFADVEAPEQIDRYVIDRRLGAGGMGVVWAARDRRLGRPVAIKLLKRCDTPGDRGRLMREAQALARLAHPNVVEVYDVGTHRGQVFIAMELVDGCTLTTWLETPRPWREILDVFFAAGRGLLAAHRAELVHRDFKSSNVMLGNDGRVRVMDFGLAHHISGSMAIDTDERPAPAESTSAVWLDAALTTTGQRVGTPATMAPEQHDGGAVDVRADQFGFCASLWEALVRRPAFAGHTLQALADAKREGRISVPPHDIEVPARVLDVVRRGLAAAPHHRFADMDTLLRALERAATRRRHWLAFTAGAALLSATAVYAAGPRTAAECAARVPDEIVTWTKLGRARVESAFDPDGGEVVARTRDHTLSTIDGHVEAWTAGRARCDALDARDPRREPMRACVERSGNELSALIAALGGDEMTRPDASVLANAIAAAAAMEPAAQCESSTSPDGVAVPSDPRAAALTARVAIARADLARVNAMHRVGRFARARALIQDLAQTAAELSDPWFDAEVDFALGSILIDDGEYAEAEAALRRAYFTASEHQHTRIAAESSTMLVFVLGSYLARPDEALDWARHSEVSNAQLDDPSLAAELDTNAGMVLGARGETEAARARFRTAIERTSARGDIGTAMQHLANSYADAGDLTQARDLLEQVIETRERRLGPGHTLVAITRVNLANTLLLLGEHEAALDHHHRALAIQVAALGPGHTEVAVQRNNLGSLLDTMGDIEAAREQHALALAVFETQLGDDHPYVGATVVNLGRIDVRRGDLDRARAELERGRAVLELALGGEHSHVYIARLGLAEVELAAHQPTRAMAVLAATPTECGETDRTLCAELSFARARALRDIGDGVAAAAAYARAVELTGTTAADDDLRRRLGAWQRD